jgi:hypothetical protein
MDDDLSGMTREQLETIDPPREISG